MKQRVAFTTNICPHYRVKTFDTLAHYHNVDYYFFSAGNEWYWQQQHGKQVGDFHFQYLPGYQMGGTRITPMLPWKLWRGNYDVYVKCISGRFALPITYLVARLKHRPFILWTGVWMRLQTRGHRLIFPFTRYIYQHADAIVTYGEHVKHYLVTEDVSSERIFTTTHAVDNNNYNQQVSESEKINILQQLGVDPQKKIVLYLGRLEESKGLPYLLEGFASLQRNDAVLVFAGAGSERQHLEALSSRLGVSNYVRFVGYVPHDKTLPYYATSWVYVLPSVTLPTGKEPWGLVVNEAFNQGLPVIASDAVGAAAGRLVEDGVNGFVIPERNSVELAYALRRILDEPNLRQQMSVKARQSIANWDNEQMVLGFRKAIEYVTRK